MPAKDVFGKALHAFFVKSKQDKLLVKFHDGAVDEMPLGMYFRSYSAMSKLEKLALKSCRGKILEAGAGAGSHAMVLQAEGHDITAMDISSLCTKIMRERGIDNVICSDIFQYTGGQFDTILMLMNGIGLAQTLDGLKVLLSHLATLIGEGGQLLFDSSDVSYLKKTEDSPHGHYYGEITYRYEFGALASEWQKWLYVDQKRLSVIAEEQGWSTEILYQDRHAQYLARLIRREEVKKG